MTQSCQRARRRRGAVVSLWWRCGGAVVAAWWRAEVRIDCSSLGARLGYRARVND